MYFKRFRPKTSMHTIKPLDLTKPVNVYRNLHKKCWSIKQGKYVVAYADNILLKDCKFHVNPNGIDKIRESGRKQVIAWVRGIITDPADFLEFNKKNGCNIYYRVVKFNPKKHRSFIMGITQQPIHTASFVDMDINAQNGNYLIAINTHP